MMEPTKRNQTIKPNWFQCEECGVEHSFNNQESFWGACPSCSRNGLHAILCGVENCSVVESVSVDMQACSKIQDSKRNVEGLTKYLVSVRDHAIKSANKSFQSRIKPKTRCHLVDDVQNARLRMQQEPPGSDKWWVAYYDLRKAESLLS